KFDKPLLFAFTEFLNARASAKQIGSLWRDHTRRLTDGEIGRRQGATIQIDESIDKDLRAEFEGFLNAAVRALKGMQNVAEAIGIKIGFLFQKEGAFRRAVADLAPNDPKLANYLTKVREEWSESLLQIRNDVEHQQWTLPDVSYSLGESVIEAGEPL